VKPRGNQRRGSLDMANAKRTRPFPVSITQRHRPALAHISGFAPSHRRSIQPPQNPSLIPIPPCHKQPARARH
jgi:hypothetical protein